MASPLPPITQFGGSNLDVAAVDVQPRDVNEWISNSENRGMLNGHNQKPMCGRTTKVLLAFAGVFIMFWTLVTFLVVNRFRKECQHRLGDEAPLVVVKAFYAAVDSKDLIAIMKSVDTDIYTAHFGPGCSTVGGARHCNNCTSNTMRAVEFARFISYYPTRSSQIERSFVAHGSSVINHYIVRDELSGIVIDHGAAAHVVSKAKGGHHLLSESFWYADKEK